ncbi:MAG TPA: hypothetical protein VM939_03990, partial [Gemmatimonadaceae bacterium]|nr:hypothetical protein [Gemmatimonadaceae bacterium]
MTQLDSLPNTARVWVFGSDRTLTDEKSEILLREVDEFLSQWNAHGTPLTSARSWLHGRFLIIGVDQSTAGA